MSSVLLAGLALAIGVSGLRNVNLKLSKAGRAGCLGAVPKDADGCWRGGLKALPVVASKRSSAIQQKQSARPC